MTPGKKVLKAFADRKYSIQYFESGNPFPIDVDASEAAGIIEAESGLVELLTALTRIKVRCEGEDSFNEDNFAQIQTISREALEEVSKP